MTAAVPEDLRMTPMLKQYAQWKKRYPDCLLFFRMPGWPPPCSI